MPTEPKIPEPIQPFSSYRPYILYLRDLIKVGEADCDREAKVAAALNGQAGAELRARTALGVRRKFGAFFTGTELSCRLVKKSQSSRIIRKYYDPTCGVGDLLLAIARTLPLEASLFATLAQWGQILMGTDLHAEFIEGARLRLILLAQQRHGGEGCAHIDSLLSFFPLVRIADGLCADDYFEAATTVLLNPPFGLVPAPEGCDWASGRITAAANFVMAALQKIRPNTEVLAILPDVLRSGTFSNQWRARVSALADVHDVEPYGVFDERADVDVFTVRLLRTVGGRRRKRWPIIRNGGAATIGEKFDVHVGRVVPHRDMKAGPRYKYVHPRCVSVWSVVREFDETRRHRGKPYRAPFVLIRRTSRPGQPFRAAATVVGGTELIAVENHFLVCLPKDGRLKTCKELMRQLKSDAVNDFLNKRICCRHLTVAAVASIPFEAL